MQFCHMLFGFKRLICTAKETYHSVKVNTYNSPHKTKQLLYTGMLQYPLLITCPNKASDYLYNKKKLTCTATLLPESKVTE